MNLVTQFSFLQFVQLFFSLTFFFSQVPIPLQCFKSFQYYTFLFLYRKCPFPSLIPYIHLFLSWVSCRTRIFLPLDYFLFRFPSSFRSYLFLLHVHRPFFRLHPSILPSSFLALFTIFHIFFVLFCLHGALFCAPFFSSHGVSV